MRDHKKRIFSNRRGGAKMFSSLVRKTGAGRLTSIWQLIGAGGDTRNAKVFAEGGAENIFDATHPKDKDAQKLPPKMLAGWIRCHERGKADNRRTSVLPRDRDKADRAIDERGRRHGNDDFDVRFWGGVKQTCPFAVQMSAFDPKRLPDMMSVYSYLALSRCSKTVVLKRNFYDDGDIGRVLPSIYRPGFRPNTQRLEPSGRRQMVTWPSGGATGIASS